MARAYTALLARPGVTRAITASLVGRLPMGFVSLAIVLTVRAAGGSFTLAGLAAGAYALLAAAAAPVLGRRVDRLGQTAILIPTILVNAAALLALAACAGLGAPGPLVVALAAAAGAALPPLSACLRALWPELVGGPAELQAAYSLEAVLQELVFILGPLLAAALALAEPALALAAAAVMVVAGGLAFARLPKSREWRPSGRPPGPAGALASPGLRTVIASTLGMAGAFGFIDVALPAFASARGSAAWAGVMIAAMATASMAGGLWYGARRWRGALDRRYRILFVVFALGLAPLALARSIPAMLGLMALAGLALAPLATCVYSLTGELALDGTTTEAFTWVNTAFVGGAALGAALGGAIVDGPGARAALLAASASALLGAGVAALRRRTLRPSCPPAGATAATG